MSVLIKKLSVALDYKPEQKTHLIKILRGIPDYDCYFPEIKDSLYASHEYVFADIQSEKPGAILFNKTIAEKIITDFQNNKESCIDLLVVCVLGQNRSPAIAIALNDIFSLGEDTEELKKKYPELNKHVYRVMMRTAEQMRLSR